MRRSSAPDRGLCGTSLRRAKRRTGRPTAGTRRGQTEPFAALVAVAVVALALGVYAGAFETVLPESTGGGVADATADRVERALTVGGVVRPGRLGAVNGTGPEGYELNVTLVVDGTSRSVGPPAPAAEAATRRVSVRRGPGVVVPGRLEVRVWT